MKEFMHSFYDTIKDVIARKCCCLYSKTKKEKFIRREKLYNKAIRKLQNEVDITSILKTLRNTNLITHIFLSKYQRKMIPYFKENIIQEGSDDEALEKTYNSNVSQREMLPKSTIE